MNTIESLQWRYAVKKFDENKSLSPAQIDLLKEAFNLTATSYGLQPVKLVVLQNKELQQRLVEHSWGQQQVAQASHVLVLCVQEEMTTAHVNQYFELVKTIRNTPDEVLNPFKSYLVEEIGNKPQEDLALWMRNQAYLALGNLLTVCAVERIDACPMEGFEPEKYDEILELSQHGLKSVLVLPVGIRAEDDYMKALKKVRRNTQEMTIDIQ